MGTRSLTRVFDDAKKGKDDCILVMYRQFDGYPTGHGKELAQFMKDGTFVNGINLDEKNKKIFNGAGCFAAQLVAHFKDGPGGFYLHSAAIKDAGQEYEYHITVPFEASQNQELVVVQVYAVRMRWPNGYDKPASVTKRLLFGGTVQGFAKFIQQEERKEKAT